MYNNIDNIKKWEKEDDLKLIKNIKENKSYHEISLELNTTIGDIRSRILDKIIFPKYDGKNIKELAQKYKYNNVENLQKCLENKKKISYENVKQVQKNIKKTESIECKDLFLKIIDRLEKIEYKIDLYCGEKNN